MTNADYGNALLEAASLGDEDGLNKLISQGVDVNFANITNGWTALHWASKRGHYNVVELLLRHGADSTLLNGKGQTAADVASTDRVLDILGVSPEEQHTATDQLPIIPNYLKYPQFPYGYNSTPPQENSHGSDYLKASHLRAEAELLDELVLKIRIANAMEPDFIEVELSKSALTFRALVTLMCQELGVSPELVLKVRKLPNTIIRKDKDVGRLKDLQELELVMKGIHMAQLDQQQYKPYVSPRSQNIVY